MRRWLQAVCGLYLAVVSFGVFGPEPGAEIDRAATRMRELESEVRDRLGAVTSSTPEVGHGSASSDNVAPEFSVAGTDSSRVNAEEFFNVLLFVPFGFLVPLCWPAIRWATVPLGAATSVGIEVIQGQFLSWRSQTSIDMDMNWLGVVIGFGLWVVGGIVLVAVRGRSRGRARQPTSPPTPTIGTRPGRTPPPT